MGYSWKGIHKNGIRQRKLNRNAVSVEALAPSMESSVGEMKLQESLDFG